MSFIISSKKTKNDVLKPENTFSPTNILHQNFRYPEPIMNYLKTIPNSMTPKLYINLLKCCKYFYSKKDLIIPLNDIYRHTLWKIILSKKESTKFKLPFKIWLTGSFYYAKLSDYYDTYFLKYAARCNIINIKLQVQEITFKEFEFLINNGVERFFCNRTTIKYCNGTVVPVEKIFAHLKSVKYVRYTFGDETAKLVTAETAKELTKVIDTSKLEKIYFYRIPTAFDFETFKKFTRAQISLEDQAFGKIGTNEQETFTNMTLLHYTCQCGIEKIDLILKGANINLKDSNRNLPSHFAAACTDNIQIIEAKM